MYVPYPTRPETTPNNAAAQASWTAGWCARWRWLRAARVPREPVTYCSVTWSGRRIVGADSPEGSNQCRSTCSLPGIHRRGSRESWRREGRHERPPLSRRSPRWAALSSRSTSPSATTTRMSWLSSRRRGGICPQPASRSQRRGFGSHRRVGVTGGDRPGRRGTELVPAPWFLTPTPPSTASTTHRPNATRPCPARGQGHRSSGCPQFAHSPMSTLSYSRQRVLDRRLAPPAATLDGYSVSSARCC